MLAVQPVASRRGMPTCRYTLSSKCPLLPISPSSNFFIALYPRTRYYLNFLASLRCHSRSISCRVFLVFHWRLDTARDLRDISISEFADQLEKNIIRLSLRCLWADKEILKMTFACSPGSVGSSPNG